MIVAGKERLSMAQGVSFDDGAHTYIKNGIALSGVTGLIGRELSLNYAGAGERLRGKQEEGKYIHGAVEKWCMTGINGSVHPAVLWVLSELEKRHEGDEIAVAYGEVLVTDGFKYASAIDIVVKEDEGLTLYDIKTGKFNPQYLCWQLGIYNYLVEQGGYKVKECVCLASYDRISYRIRPKGEKDIKRLLYGG